MGEAVARQASIQNKKTPAAAPAAVTAEDIGAVVDKLREKTQFEMQTASATDPADKPQESPVAPDGEEREAGVSEKKPPVVYGDVAVCQALRIRRRLIAAARTKNARGRDWDCVGLHAGMTKDWVYRKAAELHVTPNFDLLKPIEENDGVISCVLAAVVPNPQRVVAEIVATGERKPVWVKDSTEMRLREIFDCFDDHGTVSMRLDLNEVQY